MVVALHHLIIHFCFIKSFIVQATLWCLIKMVCQVLYLSKQNQRVVIWFLRMEEWQLDEIHRLMCAVYGEHACQIQQWWIGCVCLKWAGSEQQTCQDEDRFTLQLIQRNSHDWRMLWAGTDIILFMPCEWTWIWAFALCMQSHRILDILRSVPNGSHIYWQIHEEHCVSLSLEQLHWYPTKVDTFLQRIVAES